MVVLSHKVYNGAGIALFGIENNFQKWLPEGELKISDKGEVTAPGEFFILPDPTGKTFLSLSKTRR